MTPHRIIKSFKGSQDGIDSHQFHADDVTPLSADLARIAVGQGWAEPHMPALAIEGDQETNSTESEPEERSEGDAPANKMRKGAPENKGRK